MVRTRVREIRHGLTSSLSRPCLSNDLPSIALSMPQRRRWRLQDCSCVGDLCGAGRVGPFFVLGKPSIIFKRLLEHWKKYVLTYHFTGMEKDPEEKLAAAAFIIECLLVPGSWVIAWRLILRIIL